MANFIKSSVTILSGLSVAVGIGLDISQSTCIKTEWLIPISFAIFCVLIIFINFEQNKRIKELENERPIAVIEPTCEDAEWYLKITNKGEKGKFVADITVVRSENDVDLMGRAYKGYWFKSGGDESELMNGRFDLLHIATEYACIINETLVTDFGLHLFDDNKRQPIENRLDTGRPYCWLKVRVTAEPALKNGYVDQYYELKYNDFTKLPMLSKWGRFSRLFKRNPIVRRVSRK